MRALILALAMLLLIAPAQASQRPMRVPSASGTIMQIYASHALSLAQDKPPPWHHPDDYFTPRLAALLAADRDRAEPLLQFDPLCDGQDCAITDRRLEPAQPLPLRAVVHVHFRNLGQPVHLVFTLRLIRTGWKIDEIERPGPDGWTLTALLDGDDASPGAAP